MGRNLALKLKQKSKVILGGRNNSINNLAQQITGCQVVPMDVANINSVREIVGIYKPNIIIHAAATKYVDLSEIHPNECIDINITGSQNIARVAIDKAINTVIGISTDKAALPCSGMYSMSKAIMERLFILMDGVSNTRFCCQRMGNIAWSTGSVFPIWKRMLVEEGKIRATGIDMRRFMFSISDATKMVEDVLENVPLLHGKILAKKMKAIRMEDVLHRFIDIYGGTYERISPRIGEKMEESMIGTAEFKYTRNITINGSAYYLIDHQREDLCDLTGPVNTLNVEQLTPEELNDLIRRSTPNVLPEFYS